MISKDKGIKKRHGFLHNCKKMSNFKYHKKLTQGHVDTQNYTISLGYQRLFQEF